MRTKPRHQYEVTERVNVFTRICESMTGRTAAKAAASTSSHTGAAPAGASPLSFAGYSANARTRRDVACNTHQGACDHPYSRSVYATGVTKFAPISTAGSLRGRLQSRVGLEEVSSPQVPAMGSAVVAAICIDAGTHPEVRPSSSYGPRRLITASPQYSEKRKWCSATMVASPQRQSL